MTVTTSTLLERALQQHGDDLYRLALLLTPDDAHAAAALHRAISRLVDTPLATLDEPSLIAALAVALPAERRRLRRQRPAWARLPAEREEAPLVAALAQLPCQQRLALGLTLLRGFDAAQAASALGANEADIRALARDALRALAPFIQPDLAPDALDADSVPEACCPTRVALALGGDLAHADPATRGHLALCGACRAAEQAWQRLTTAVENALRGALRDMTLPEHLTNELRAATARTPRQPQRSLLAGQRGRLALVALAVIAVIALLVLPGHRAPAIVSTGAAASAPAALAPRDLVEHALDQLYAPPTGTGVWHGHWQIRWSFAGGSYTTLDADAWIDTDSSRHRVQLVHADGGGPFEFELADEASNMWYATTQSYAPSLYPALFEPNQLRARLQITPDEARRMLRARLTSGAWDLAGAYLRQAQAAHELRSWGRQRTPDGATLEIISFDGFDPLALPADAPGVANVPTTILLAIDVQSGALHEVRELSGPEGGERSSRTTWRFVAGEWLTATQDIQRAFDQRRAWNGTGDFGELQAGYADPALPLIPASRVTSLASTLQQKPALWLPARPPPGAERALLLTSDDGASIWIVYLGTGRRLVIRALFGPDGAGLGLDGAETIAVNGQQIALQPLNGLGYQARLTYRGPFDEPVRIGISLIGYTRAELLGLLGGFGPPTAEAYRAQAGLFADPQAHDPASFDALLGALATPPQPPASAARHFVERTFTRHTPTPDPFGDPYHLPFYGGRPKELLIENWVRADSGRGESSSTERGANGIIYGRQYLGPMGGWYYDAPSSLARRVRTRDLALINRINLDQSIVFDLLVRGSGQLVTLPDGTREISSSQPLANTHFYDELANQQRDPGAGGPYLVDLYIDTTVTTLISLGADGRPWRIETWAASTPAAGPGRDKVLLEAWELVSDEQVPADRIPAGTFDTDPPAALTFRDYEASPPFPPNPATAPATMTITNALQLVRAPLLVLPPDPDIDAPLVEAANPANRQLDISDNDVFTVALDRSLAIRLTYLLPTGGPLKRQTSLYEGDAKTFGAYLRTQSAWHEGWQSSKPIRITIGKRTIDGWQITESGAVWTLFEVDGTLLAMQTTYNEQAAALTRLQPLGHP